LVDLRFVLELQLNAALEELSIALESESIEAAIPVGHFKTHVVGHVPVDLRGEPGECSSRQLLTVKIDS
jgi:hypothetical protein